MTCGNARWGLFWSVRPSPAVRGCIRPSVGNACANDRHSVIPVRAMGVSESCLDPLSDGLVLSVDALGVDAEQDVDTVAGPLGDMGGGHAGVEPQGDRGMPKVVRAPGQRRRVQKWAEGFASCLVPDPVDDAHRLRSRIRAGQGRAGASGAGDEDSAVRTGRKPGEVLAQDRHELRAGPYFAGVLAGPVFELSVLVALAGVGPLSAGSRCGTLKVHKAPTGLGQPEVALAKMSRLGRPQACVVQAREVRLD